MIIEKDKLLQALKQAMPGVETGTSIIDGSDTFVIKDGAVHSYNDAISVSVPLPEAGELEGVVKANEFYNFISKLTGAETVNITEGEGEWVINIPEKIDAHFKLLDVRVSEYLEGMNIPSLEYSPLPEAFNSALRLCRIGNNPSMYTGIFVGGGVMLSTDGIRANQYIFPDVEIEVPFQIEDDAANELFKLEDVIEYSVSEAWVHFRTSSGSVFSCKRKDEQSYISTQIIELIEAHKQEDGDVSNTFAKGMVDAVKRVATMSVSVADNDAVGLRIEKARVVVESTRSTGKITEYVPFETPFEAEIEPLVIWVDPDYIIAAASSAPDFYIKKVNGQTNLVFTNADFTQIVSTYTTLAE